MEIGVVSIGTAANIGLTALLIAALAVTSRLCGPAPHLLHNIVAAFGLATAADPALVLVVDICRSNWTTGDAFKLFHHFETRENSGGIGVFLILMIYGAYLILSYILMNVFFFYVYRDGRILDVFRRVEGKEDNFFIPVDLELTITDLQLILHKAESWRGPGSAKRRTIVTDIRVFISPPNAPESVVELGCASHVGVFTNIPPTDTEPERNELHRHFLKLPDGTIVEISGDELRFLQPVPVCNAVDNIVRNCTGVPHAVVDMPVAAPDIPSGEAAAGIAGPDE
mmetsp:Transcript_13504/g.29133  ORF Transcript_13504/g.29133 Transcript_13504/m.29133 type:complete len:283 (-) Transcript_13504:1550-2398(-)